MRGGEHNEMEVSSVSAAVAVLISIIGMVIAIMRNGGADINSLRQEFEAKIERNSAQQTTLRHDATATAARAIAEIGTELRHLEKSALTKGEGTEMERRIMSSFGELKIEMRRLYERAEQSGDALARIMAKMRIARHGENG
jgi:hypothetical protein